MSYFVSLNLYNENIISTYLILLYLDPMAKIRAMGKVHRGGTSDTTISPWSPTNFTGLHPLFVHP
jgi:hypothetical protein